MLVRHLIPEERHHSVQEDFYRDAYTGEIDTVTGFALVASMQTCFVWQHAQVCDQLGLYPLSDFHRLSEVYPLAISSLVPLTTSTQPLLLFML